MTTDFPDSHRDLLEAKFATLATLGKDGGPQLTEVWFLFEDGQVKTSLNDSRLKTKNLGAKYDADVRDHDGPGEKRVVVTIEPTNVFAVDMGA
jgi:hypothetical protein